MDARSLTTSAVLPLRPDRKERHIFCDESGLNDRFFVLGSLYSPSDSETFRSDIETIKRKHRLKTEIKWEKLPTRQGQFLDGYNAVIERWIDSPLTYKALIVDTQKYPLNHREFTGGDHTIGYYQFYLTLLFNGYIRHDPVYNVRIHLHNPAYKLNGGLGRLEDKINEAALNHGFPDISGNSCCRISAHTAMSDSLIQLADILSGLVSGIWNGKIIRQTKRDLFSRCCEKLGMDISKPSESRHADQKLNRWLFTPREDKEEAKKWPALHPPTK
jgi:hypothetical protein